MNKLLLLGCFWVLPLLAEPPMVVGELSLHYPPFHFTADDERPGVYSEMVHAVLDRAGLEYQEQWLTYDQLKPAFKEGRISILCCSHPAWWEALGGIDHQLFSMPLAENRDLWIFPRGGAFNPVSELDGKRVALIRLFGYRGVNDERIERIDHDDVDQLLLTVSEKRADAGIVNEWVLLWELKKQALLLDLPQEQDRVTLHMLVGPQWRDQLPAINDAIDQLHGEGVFEQILRSYLPGYRPVEFPADQLLP